MSRTVTLGDLILERAAEWDAPSQCWMRGGRPLHTWVGSMFPTLNEVDEFLEFG